MAEELITADVEQSYVEYRANFKEPITSVWFNASQGSILTQMQKVLLPWKVGLQNISFNPTPKNLAEFQVTFSVPSLGAAIQVTLDGVIMSAVNVDWSRRSQYISFFQTAADSLKAAIKADLEAAQTTLAFHLRPGPKPFREILKHFVNMKALGVEDAQMYGVSAYCDEYSWVLDGSAVLPNGLFIKLVRLFPAGTRFEKIVAKIYEDEEAILRRLGFKVQ